MPADVANNGMPVLHLLADRAVVTHMCDRLMIMQHGQEVEQLAATDLAARKVTQDYTRGLLAASEGFRRNA